MKCNFSFIKTKLRQNILFTFLSLFVCFVLTIKTGEKKSAVGERDWLFSKDANSHVSFVKNTLLRFVLLQDC